MTFWRSNALVLTVLLPLASCQTISPALLTQTTGRTGDFTDAEIAELVCNGPLRNLSYDSRVDSELTADQIRRYNRERDAYCATNKEKSR